MSSIGVADRDFDVGGLARIRLADAAPGDVGRVARQLGVEPSESSGDADLTVRYVRRLALSGPLRILGAREVGYAGDAFVLLGRGMPRAIVPFDQVGHSVTIIARSGSGVPDLVPMLNLTMLGKGILPLHASAFTYQGRGIAAAAWSKGGKTEALLAFMAAGADLVADEWTYVAPDGRMAGFRGPLRLLAWHLRQLPDVRRQLGRRRWLGLAGADGAATVLDRLAASRVPAVAVAARRAVAVAGPGHLDASPVELFGPSRCPHTGRLDELFLLERRDAPQIDVRPIAGRAVAERMAFAHLHHRLSLIGRYWQFRYAFPDRRAELLDDVAGVERALLDRALSDRPARLVEHPGQVDLRRLFEAMAERPGDDAARNAPPKRRPR